MIPLLGLSIENDTLIGTLGLFLGTMGRFLTKSIPLLGLGKAKKIPLLGLGKAKMIPLGAAHTVPPIL